MQIIVREFVNSDIESAIAIWNEVVKSGAVFPQIETLDEMTGRKFFENQSYTGIAVEEESNVIVGLYILHPNNIGQYKYICNVNYVIKGNEEGLCIDEALVKDCIEKAKELGFKILQFNAVVAANAPALYLYEKLGFTKLGVIPKGFLMKDGSYQDIIPHYRTL
ncbi:GNAT family N-acetyltransferase [Clostridium massiliamazoniense]|uniref:GNAT family N-acetyltransferase n=1 Tax=Clostridium massiliamazoniense TaxID=1347366 RepID=UPI0006D7BCEC|nr:GNAT family N-acetyltransferase [Clostridium massiliamazoniense]